MLCSSPPLQFGMTLVEFQCMDASQLIAAPGDADGHDGISTHVLSGAKTGPSSGSARMLLHGAAITIAWLLFAMGWVKVWSDSSPGTVEGTLVLLGATLAMSLTITGLWIWHNVSIFHRKGPRLTRPDVKFTDQRDFLGHQLVGVWDEIVASQIVRVRIDERTKHFCTAEVSATGAVKDALAIAR
jgi:hypothetical protein